MSAAGGGINTAIASGAAFGKGGGGGVGPGESAVTMPGKMGFEGASHFLAEKMSTMFNETVSLGGFGGLGLNNMSMLGKGKLFDIFSSIGGGDGGGDASGGGGSAASSGSTDSAPYSALSGAMLPPGVAGGEPVPHDRLGQLFPDPTPSLGGRGQSVERD